jgi:NAD(P)-dependent dehydrogenase (short-subunit alcohol dehydrogenase family)
MIDYMKKFKLEEKTAVVCGGLGLIGKEVSIALAQSGANVLIFDIDKKKFEIFTNKLEKEREKIKFYYFDITDLHELKKNITSIYKKEKKIDVWINLAYPRTQDWCFKLEEVSIDSWVKNVNMHLNSYCLITRDIAELMKNNQIKGSIINYGSTYGVVGPDFEIYSGTKMTSSGIYAAIKGGILNFSRYAASYYGKFNIRVNCLCPGGIFNNQNQIFVENYEQRTPLRRMGIPEDIASATLFLASDASSYITGSTFMVDGGWTSI